MTGLRCFARRIDIALTISAAVAAFGPARGAPPTTVNDLIAGPIDRVLATGTELLAYLDESSGLFRWDVHTSSMKGRTR